MSFISLDNISFSYSDIESGQPYKNAVDGVSLNIEKGEFVALLGHNGCGKSTVAKHLNAMLLPDKGKVYVDGDDTSDENKTYDIREKVGLVLQNPDNQLVASVVEEDVAFGPENLGIPPKEIRQRVDDALKAVDMYDYREHAPFKLSGGQKQRIAIAGILAMQPQCIVLDEPTAMLDPNGRDEVMTTRLKLNREKNMSSSHTIWKRQSLPTELSLWTQEKSSLRVRPKMFFHRRSCSKSTVLMFRRQQSLHTDSGGAE